MKKLICTVGLPRSGKSTWAKEQSYPIVNPDSIRLALHGQRFVKLAEEFVWAIAKVMVRSLFIAGHDIVILDATCITRKSRNSWLSGDWETYFQLFVTSKQECAKRAGDDQEMIEVIERMAYQFEPLEKDEKLWQNQSYV